MVAIEFVTVVEKLASAPKASLSSFNVSNALGALFIKLLIAVETKAVVAILVVLFPADWVVAVDNLAAATVPEPKFEAFNPVKAEASPAKPEATNNPELELKVKFEPDFAATTPEPPVANKTLQEVSEDSSATVKVAAFTPNPSMSDFV